MNEDRIEQKLDQLLEGQSRQREALAQLQQSHLDLMKTVNDHHCVLFGSEGRPGLRLQFNSLHNAHDAHMGSCMPTAWWKVVGTAITVNVASYSVIAALAFWMYMAILHGKR